MTDVARHPQQTRHYRGSVQKLFSLSDEQVLVLATALSRGTVVFVTTPLELRPIGVSAERIAELENEAAGAATKKAVAAAALLADARRVNEMRQRMLSRWLDAATTLPNGWKAHLVATLRPDVTYVHYMEVGALLVENN